MRRPHLSRRRFLLAAAMALVLSHPARAQSEDLGRAFRTLRIPLEGILASPVFRARDTAELAFGADRIKVTTDLVADEYAGPQLRPMLDAIGRLLRTPPRPGTTHCLSVTERRWARFQTVCVSLAGHYQKKT